MVEGKAEESSSGSSDKLAAVETAVVVRNVHFRLVVKEEFTGIEEREGDIVQVVSGA